MKNKISILLLLCFSISFAQANKIVVKDTVNAVIGNVFTIPSQGSEVRTNQLAVPKYELKLVDANEKVLSDQSNFKVVRVFQNPDSKKIVDVLRESRGRGTAVSLVPYCTIDAVGSYYVKTFFSGRSETEANYTSNRLYLVNVTLPTISSPTPDAFYYPKEQDKFSFATMEYNDAKLYSYVINKVDKDGKVIAVEKEEVTGSSFVDLGPIINAKNGKLFKNIGAKFEVVGKYNGNSFKYKNVKGEEKESKWVFEVRPISDMNFVTVWTESEKVRSYIDMRSSNAFSGKFIRVVAEIGKGDKKAGNTILISDAPNCNGLQVTAEPSEFLAGKPTFKIDGGYLVIELKPNTDFLTVAPQHVKLKVSFKSQHGPFSKTFYGEVFRSEDSE